MFATRFISNSLELEVFLLFFLVEAERHAGFEVDSCLNAITPYRLFLLLLWFLMKKRNNICICGRLIVAIYLKKLSIAFKMHAHLHIPKLKQLDENG